MQRSPAAAARDALRGHPLRRGTFGRICLSTTLLQMCAKQISACAHWDGAVGCYMHLATAAGQALGAWHVQLEGVTMPATSS
jgi:hypothetical protein